jgi:hypothetical protein
MTAPGSLKFDCTIHYFDTLWRFRAAASKKTFVLPAVS